jgi:hypothetical protein
MVFEAPLPADMQTLLDWLRAHRDPAADEVP